MLLGVLAGVPISAVFRSDPRKVIRPGSLEPFGRSDRHEGRYWMRPWFVGIKISCCFLGEHLYIYIYIYNIVYWGEHL